MTTATFAGSIPQTYHTFLGPLIFDAYARDLATRLKSLAKANARVLEIACGTGIVTKELLASLPAGGSFIASDLSEPMLTLGRANVVADARLTFQQADACALPFKDKSFDLIACQFGVMFFPDKVKAMQESRRVLTPGGTYLFSIWDSLAANPIPRVEHETIAALFPKDPPQFLAKFPYGYSDRAEIDRVTRAGGFANVKIETAQFPCTAPAAEDAARGFVEGTPILPALQERGVTDIAPVRAAVTKALAEKFGDRPCRSTMSAIVVTAS
ncbi:MAG: class I SAM-dependent methyltransferase [Phycisphaerales bacterium]